MNKASYQNCVCVPLTIISHAFVVWYWMGNTLFFGENYLYDPAHLNLFTVMHVTWAIIYLSSRLIGILYFAFGYNFQHLSITPKNDIYNKLIYNECQQMINQTNTRLKAILFINIFIFYPFHFVVFYYYLIKEQKPNPLIIQYIGRIIELLVIFIPIAVTSCCLSLILLKYKIELHLLTETLKKYHDFEDVHKKYKEIINSFKKDLDMKLFNKIDVEIWKMYFFVQILAYFCEAWIATSLFLHNRSNVWEVVHALSAMLFYVTPFIEIVLGSDDLSKQYLILRQEIVNNSPKLSDNDDVNEKLNQVYSYQNLYNYTMEHRLRFEIGGHQINISNTLKVVCFFIITKLISYVVYHVDTK